jgi:acyl carrier protein
MLLIHPYKLTLKQELVQLINVHKNVAPAQLFVQSFDEIGFDTVDLVDIILEVEKAFHTYIPDDVPLNKVDDFVSFLTSDSSRADA